MLAMLKNNYLIVNASFPSSTNSKIILDILLHDLCYSHFEILVGNMNASFS